MRKIVLCKNVHFIHTHNMISKLFLSRVNGRVSNDLSGFFV